MSKLQADYEQAKAAYEVARSDYRAQRIYLSDLQRAEDKRFHAGVRWFRSPEFKSA